MKKTFIKITILFFLLLLFGNFVFAAEDLEVDYPIVRGIELETTSTPLGEYVRYVFNFAIYATGILAFLLLVIAGIRYLSSIGKPEKLKTARKQILAVFWGIVILFSSFLILRYINPQLIKLEEPDLPSIPLADPLELTPVTVVPTGLLSKVKELAKNVKLAASSVNEQTNQLTDRIQDCDCGEAVSMCICEELEIKGGGGILASCVAQKCYIADPNTQPCPDGSKIKENQQNLIAWRYELLYFRNRALAEKQDLDDEIEKIINEKIDFYEQKIAAETSQTIIDFLREEQTKQKNEKQLKKQLADKLEELADKLEEISQPMLELSQLPNECVYTIEEGEDGEKEYKSTIEEKCEASCKTDYQTGCHDAERGCWPDTCGGGNPCPTGEIQDRSQEISRLLESAGQDSIVQIAKDIIKKIEEIIELRIYETFSLRDSNQHQL